MNKLLHKMFRWCPLYRAVVGGYWYYSQVQEKTYDPKQFCSLGLNVRIGANVFIRAPEKMKIGHDVFIGSNCTLDALGGLQIGNCCALASHATVLTVDHHHRGAESIPWGEARIVKPVVIEDYVWIGMNASILPGVTIGEGAIVGLGAVVPKDVSSRAIVVGNPAKVVGYRDEEEYSTLKSKGAVKAASSRCGHLWTPPEMLEKYHDLLQEVGYDVDSGQENFDFIDSGNL